MQNFVRPPVLAVRSDIIDDRLKIPRPTDNL